MVIRRGEVWWASLPDPRGSEPGYRRPVLVIQSDAFNRSSLRTVTVVALTSNLRLADAPGNVFLREGEGGLPKASVVNVSQVLTLDRRFLSTRAGLIPPRAIEAVEKGLRLALRL